MPKALSMFLLFLSLGSLCALRISDYDQGVVILKLKRDTISSKSSTGLADIDTRLAAFGLKAVEPRFPTAKSADLGRILKIHFDSSYDALGVCNSLSAHPDIEYIEPLYIDEVLDAPNDTYYPSTLNFASLQAEAAWAIHKCENGSEDVILAIVDSGVKWMHPDIAENIWNNIGEDANSNGYTLYHNGTAWVMDSGDINGIDDDGNGKIDDLIGWDFMVDALGTQGNNPDDPGTHGTNVSGLAGARTNNGIGAASLSWNPVIMPISCARPGATSTIYNGYDAIIYAAENGAHVINCSWGGPNYANSSRDAIAYAQSLGAIIVAAAGNNNNSVPTYPAAYPGVLSIASLMNSGAKWSGSSYGGFVDAGAPNESVYTITGPSSYVSRTGTTSYASPIGAAAVALIRSLHPDWSTAQVINQFKATCDDVNALNGGLENLLGAGKINAFRALSEVNPSQSPHLHLAMFELGTPTDTNANSAVEPGESFQLNFTLRNYSDFSAPVQIALSSTSPYVVINQASHSAMLPADNWLEISEAFNISVQEDTPSSYLGFTITISSETPILSGSTQSFNILVHNGGSFVWEAKAGARNQSGVFIRDALLGMGKEVVYGTSFPTSFHSFDAVYLSFGAVDANVGRFSSLTMYGALRNYLEAGGRVYLEGADTVAWDMANYFPLIDGINDGHEILWPLLGIASANDGATNSVTALIGQPGPTNGLLYNSSNQTNVSYIDTFEPLPGLAVPAFIEDDYGIVGIASAGGYDQRCVIFSYALAELSDAKASTRLDFLQAVTDFYEADEATLAVNLSSFTATWQNAAMLTWQTASETDLAGWNVYRGTTDLLADAIRLNPVSLPPAAQASQGADYSFTDAGAQRGNTYYYWLEALYYEGISDYFGHYALTIPVIEEEGPPAIILPTALLPAFPNPFNAMLNIPYRIAEAGRVEIDIYDLKGRKIHTQSAAHPEAGKYHLNWNTALPRRYEMPSGVYLIRMTKDGRRYHSKAILLK